MGPAASVTWSINPTATPSTSMEPRPQPRPLLTPVPVTRPADSMSMPASMTAMSPAWPSERVSPKAATAITTVTASQADATLETTVAEPRCNPV